MEGLVGLAGHSPTASPGRGRLESGKPGAQCVACGACLLVLRCHMHALQCMLMLSSPMSAQLGLLGFVSGRTRACQASCRCAGTSRSLTSGLGQQETSGCCLLTSSASSCSCTWPLTSAQSVVFAMLLAFRVMPGVSALLRVCVQVVGCRYTSAAIKRCVSAFARLCAGSRVQMRISSYQALCQCL